MTTRTGLAQAKGEYMLAVKRLNILISVIYDGLFGYRGMRLTGSL